MIEVWPEAQWRGAEVLHRERARKLLGHRLQPSRNKPSDPVGDFLFTYYRFPPGRLARWDPGTGIVLSGPGASGFLTRTGYAPHPNGVTAPPETLSTHRRDGLRRTLALLEATAVRPARFGCAGLHEWAMVYRTEAIRHGGLSLRMTPAELAFFVESRPMACTHFDAYRFFTPEAVSRNAWSLDRGTQMTHEQSGCLHANMDLYKWSHKFSPWIGSDLVLDCFELAVEARKIDMRASPYDLRGLGYDPIPVETEAGRNQYEQAQRVIAARAAPLRQRLITALRALAAGFPDTTSVGPLP